MIIVSCKCGWKCYATPSSEVSCKLCGIRLKDRTIPIGSGERIESVLVHQWQLDRKAICDQCPHKEGGECGILKAAGKGCALMGVRGIPSETAKCPIGSWGPVADKQ